MLKISKIIGTAGLLVALVPAAVFAQTNGKVMPAKASLTPPVAVTTSDLGNAPVPTLYDQGNGGNQYQGAAHDLGNAQAPTLDGQGAGNQYPSSAQFGQRQGFGGRGMMGGNTTAFQNSGRGMAGSTCSNPRPSGSMAVRVLLALIGGITLILVWSFLFMASAIMCKKLKMMGGCCKRGQDEKKPEETK